MLKIVCTWLRRLVFLGLLLSHGAAIAAFDPEASLKAINSFKQALSDASSLSMAAASLAEFDVQLEKASTSDYLKDRTFSTAMTNAAHDLAEIRFLLTNPPTERDLIDLEEAYDSYITAIESFKLQAQLESLQKDAEQSVDEARMAVEDLLVAFNTAKTFLVPSS